MSCAATVSGKEGSGGAGASGVGSSVSGGGNVSSAVNSGSVSTLGIVSGSENNVQSSNVSSSVNSATAVATVAASGNTTAASAAAAAAAAATAAVNAGTISGSVTGAANSNPNATGGSTTGAGSVVGPCTAGGIIGVARDGMPITIRAAGASSGMVIGSHLGAASSNTLHGAGVPGHVRLARFAMEGVGARVIRGPDWKWGKQVNQFSYSQNSMEFLLISEHHIADKTIRCGLFKEKSINYNSVGEPHTIIYHHYRLHYSLFYHNFIIFRNCIFH